MANFASITSKLYNMTIDELLYLQSGEKLPHLSDPITIDNLLLQFKFGSYEIEKIRDDVPGKTMVVFKTPITWRDEDSRIFQSSHFMTKTQR